VRYIAKKLDSWEAALGSAVLGRTEVRVQEVAHIYLFPLLTAVQEVQVEQDSVAKEVVAKDTLGTGKVTLEEG